MTIEEVKQETRFNLEAAFENNKNLNWDYDMLSENEYITWNMIRNNLQKPWNFSKLSCNAIITWEHVIDTPFLRWDYDALTINNNITIDIICDNIEHPWNFKILENISTKDEYNRILYAFENYVEPTIDTFNSYDNYMGYIGDDENSSN